MWPDGGEALSPPVSTLCESLSCSICTELFKDPKQLPCGHTFCGGCIDELVKLAACSSVNAARLGLGGRLFGTVISCPQCRRQTSVQKEGLAVNFIVKEMVTKMETLAVQQEPTRDCLACVAPVLCSKLFVCRSCTTSGSNPTTSHADNFFLCSYCAMTTHKGHDVSQCSEFASREDSAKAVADLTKSSDYSRRYFEQIVREQVEIESAMEQTKDILMREFCRFQALIDCAQSPRTMPLKSHLVEQVNMGQKLNGHFHDAYLEFSQKSKKAMLNELKRLNERLEILFASSEDPSKGTETEASGPDEDPSSLPSTSTNANLTAVTHEDLEGEIPKGRDAP